MNPTPVELIARALLYEGYILYPYRPTALKNRQRWSPGALVPRACGEAQEGEPWFLQAECLVRGDSPVLTTRLRFLHLFARIGASADWQEATEQDIPTPETRLGELVGQPRRVPFAVAPACELDVAAERLQHGITGSIE